MGFDWESVLGTSGADLEQAYDAAVSAVMYPDPIEAESALPLPVGAEHDEIDSLHQ
ncbi:hypothetical protein [Amycolatopsis coloradensis]|uniref:hypothetical protein n=1 Tax=Amycolatopsis coloradensis TaxID=76021 RepID=UPI00142E003C|nr:hypothetical protein [Amycolatopsis coloradensis]